MDFTYRKPTHLFALLLLLGTFFIFIFFPLISLFFPSQFSSIDTGSMGSFQRFVFEMILLVSQLVVVFAGLIIVPVLWYTIVNQISLKEMFIRLQLTKQGLNQAVLWGIVAIIIAMMATALIGLLFSVLTNTELGDLSNIPDLQRLFSIPSLYIIVLVQPFCEEFFFRGFLLEKITKISNWRIAVVMSSVLFGLSHLSYTHWYTAFVAMILGVIFSLIVIRTKNLFSAIFAHTIMNLISLTLFLFAKSIGM